MKGIFLGILILLTLTSCGFEKTNEEEEFPQVTQNQNNSSSDIQSGKVESQEKILVSASIIPLSSVINAVGGEYVEVQNIIPAGVSPHGFDLSAQQMTTLTKSQKVFMTGLEHIDGFLEKAVDENKQVHLADEMELIELEGHEHHDEHEGEDHNNEHNDEHHDDHEEEGHHDKHENEHSGEEGHNDDHSSDPHVWLGKENITQIAQKVRDELSIILPEQAEYFSANTENFITELENTYNDFVSQTSGKTPGEFIVFHDAYNYLMQSVEMDMNLKVPFSENVLHETGTAHFAELIEEVELHGIKYIFSEPQFQSGNIEKFAEEYDLTIGILDPLGTNPEATGYIQNLKNNLESLSKVYE